MECAGALKKRRVLSGVGGAYSTQNLRPKDEGRNQKDNAIDLYRAEVGCLLRDASKTSRWSWSCSATSLSCKPVLRTTPRYQGSAEASFCGTSGGQATPAWDIAGAGADGENTVELTAARDGRGCLSNSVPG